MKFSSNCVEPNRLAVLARYKIFSSEQKKIFKF